MSPERERLILRQAARPGGELPEFIRNAPRLNMGLELYQTAFADLNGCRPSGWAMTPIPWTAIKDYADAFELELEQREDLFYYIRQLDSAYIEFVNKKNAKST